MYTIKPIDRIRAEVYPPPDKSVSHRAVLISAISKGDTQILNFLRSNDTLATLDCIKRLGIEVKYLGPNKLLVKGCGKYFPIQRKVELNAQESGTTIRIISGLLVGQKFSSKIYAESSLRNRPMKRVTQPLRMMGANIYGENRYGKEELPPLLIEPTDELKSIHYSMPVGSAQVKSAIILAGLFAKGITKIRELIPSRDHTERLLKLFKANIEEKKGYILCSESQLTTPGKIFIPGDFSSAAFFIVLGTISPDSQILIKDVGINPTRIGLIRILKKMGADIKILNRKNYFEPYADILVKSSNIKGITIDAKYIPTMIDEMPIIFVCAAFAKGETTIFGLKELKVKETDRINSMVYNLKKAGVDIEAKPFDNDWMVKIKGGSKDIFNLKSLKFKSFSDHRTAMSMIIFSLATGNTHYIDDIGCIDKSFPEFISIVDSLRKK
ncbi:MAG: 3-phosphoshikimate 1-carboxyvinyltransferase [Candidatus Omnitrophica bacterium]|nr:3-phosphoshikimate 1-carboxyvinyltransferase [Candidatus Omnitrophota bacterium]